MILHRYIGKTILTSTFLVLLILLALYGFMDFINELDDLGQGDYGLKQIALYMAFSMPKRLYELLPVAALIGSVLGLGQLASQSELTAMRAAGLSVKSISRAVLTVALILMAFAVFIGEIITPWSEQKALSIQSVAQTGEVDLSSSQGFWARDRNNFNYIQRITQSGRFEGIKIYEFDEHNQLRVVTHAESAHYENDQWQLQNVTQSLISEQGVEVRTLDRANWHTRLNPDMLNVIVVPPEFLPVWKLLDYISYLKSNHQTVSHYQLAFWTKLMMPISAAVMVFLAVPFVFGLLRSSPIGGRILAGTLMGIGFHLFNQSFQHLGLVFGILPWLAASLPTVLFATIGFIFLKRVR